MENQKEKQKALDHSAVSEDARRSSEDAELPVIIRTRRDSG
jgi:hypothetical protein